MRSDSFDGNTSDSLAKDRLTPRQHGLIHKPRGQTKPSCGATSNRHDISNWPHQWGQFKTSYWGQS